MEKFKNIYYKAISKSGLKFVHQWYQTVVFLLCELVLFQAHTEEKLDFLG
jgi:hypothetical protein